MIKGLGLRVWGFKVPQSTINLHDPSALQLYSFVRSCECTLPHAAVLGAIDNLAFL